uniref:Tumor necrosis factor alpha-induced protein 2-like n=1 Tax=Callorhinchus milii TaxID=7868 RepID=A0A4W3IXL8_CALMI|eukprot:gi/632942580/ref/XP_007886486.1/ PREDICTED: tumor necrosis factor alpha-induced protein 2-like isoform X1 [Callorhinchus milii]
MKKLKVLLLGNCNRSLTDNNSPMKQNTVFSSPRTKLNGKNKLNAMDNNIDILEINGKLWHNTKLLPVEDIKELIEQKRYLKADQHLIKLEYQCYSSDSIEKDEDKLKMEQEVESLYEHLDSAITTVLKTSMSISKENPDLLKMVVQFRIQEEKMDQTYQEEAKRKSGRIPKARPRGWKNKWLNILQQSVDERISKIPNASEDNKINWVIQCLGQLLKELKEDVDTIVNHVKPCYPEDYNICKTYADCYQKTISSRLTVITENELKGKDLYTLLRWIYVHYPGVMSTLTQTEDADQKLWRDLLSQEMINQMENGYISAVQTDAKAYMSKSLQMEEMNWINGKEPLMFQDCYHSELPIDIIQIFDGGAREASCLTPDLNNRVLGIMLDEMMCFLESFQESVKCFEKTYLDHENFISTMILVNNICESFREYLNKNGKITNEVKENALSILNKMEKNGKDVLQKSLFCELKPYCKFLITEKWVSHPEPINNILEITQRQLIKFRKLKAQQFQGLLEEIHEQLIAEYISRIMKRKLSCKTEDQQKAFANQLEKEDHQLQELFSVNGSRAVGLATALPYISEIIRLQDVNAIKMEVGALIQEFPDIRKQHVAAILYIKKNMKKSDEKDILHIIKELLNYGTDSSTSKTLFSNAAVLKTL